MDNIFVDSDVILDLLTQREPFYKDAVALFSLSERGLVRLHTSSLCFSNLNYLLSKQFNASSARRILKKLKSFVKVLAVDEKVIDQALNSEFSDFEDAIQYCVAIENGISILITRNLKDYKKSIIPVMTAEVYLQG